jgi:hypothetical protein
MKPQYITIDEDGDKFYYSDKAMTKLHREDGPACEMASGGTYWCINGETLTETEFKARKSPCNGKKVTVDGIEYTLKA